ncbi:unnamed protein product [Rotaria sordida]|uniref:G-protein coupled receptors family 1 profile domain-containing protein n=1 Tax=Rotaria sordida TaxID=392033 RepID=A0A814PTL9_9BILA|nr:unnamed protein product [Rotaria sordida]CAF1321875.1 unnamed protein product [Rotaria sordida]
MSSSSFIATLGFVTRQINIFAGTSIFIAGVIGGLLTTIVFLSLRTFRDSPCAFYLSVMSFVNIGQLLTGLLSRITTNMSGIDWTQLSLFYYQYLATCQRPRWQRWSNLKSARCLSIVCIMFSILTAIPCLIYYTHNVSLITGKISCTATNGFFIQLNIYFYRLIMSNVLPLFIALVFGSLTYRNVKEIAYRTIPLVRRELDKQLTAMILVQDIFTFMTILPIMTLGFLSFNPAFIQNSLAEAEFQFANVIAVMFYYLYFTCPFYIYICVSERFRRQLKYVLLDTHLNRWRRTQANDNQVMPQI